MEQMTLGAVFNRQKEQKAKARTLKKAIRDAFANSKAYQEVNEQMVTLKAKKASIETSIREEYTREVEQIERLTLSIKQDKDLLSDMAITKFMKGETIEIVDEQDAKYEPHFQVTFRKT